MNKLVFILLLVLFLSSTSGCHDVKKEAQQVEQVNCVIIESLDIDNYFVKGKNRQVFTEVPQRVLVVGENQTETLIELGAAPNILMTMSPTSRKHDMKEKNLKTFQSLTLRKNMYLNKEYVTQLNPDLIIAQQYIFVRNRLSDTQYWNEKGIKTLVSLNTNSPSSHFYEETVEMEMQFIKDLGEVFHQQDNAERIIENTYKTIDLINEKNKDLYKPKVMAVEFMSFLVSYDRTKLVGNMIEKIGGRISENSAVIGFENIIKEDPDVLFVVCSHADYGVCINKILDNRALKNLNCIKNQRVHSIPLRFTYGPGCRTQDGIIFLAERMYPEIKSLDYTF